MLKKNYIHPWQKSPKIIEQNRSLCDPKVTIVMPVFNQESIIQDVLLCLCSSMGYPFKLIIIDDGSDDASQVIIMKFLKEKFYNFSLFCSYVIIKNKIPIYETACDNQGFRYAQTEYIIECQSDVFINELNFDIKMIKVLEASGAGTVSGRLIHPFSLLDNMTSWFRYPFFKFKSLFDRYFQCAGLMGENIFVKNPINFVKNSYYIGETNARGPWLLRKSDLMKLNYLDEKNFFLDEADHDYNRRIYENFGKKAAYVPIEQTSFFLDGSTRKQRKGVNLKIYNYLKKKKQGSKNYKYFLSKYHPYSPLKILKLNNKN